MTWGATYFVTRRFLPAEYPLYGAAIRALPAGLLLLLRRRLPHSSWWWRSLVLDALNMGAFLALVYLAAQLLPTSIAATIMATSPVVMMLFAWAALATQAYASVIWDGDAAKGIGVFGNGNCASPGTITTVTDTTRGTVWRFNKPKGDSRCEAHGIKVGGKKYGFQNNSTYYLAWSMKLSSTVDSNANFQWKSYGHHIQNYPLVLKMRGGKLTLLNRQPGGKDYYPWSMPLGANTWINIVVGIHTPDALTGGWVEVYINGVQQTFSNGQKRWAYRTMDDINDPKWGVYGASGTAVANYVDGLKVGTTYADVQ